MIIAAVVLGWRIYRVIVSVRDITAELARDIEGSNRRLEAARDNVSRLTEEIHQRELAAIRAEVDALKDRVAEIRSRPDQ